jgi:hypothetical protein
MGTAATTPPCSWRADSALCLPYTGPYTGRGPRRISGDKRELRAIPERSPRQATDDDGSTTRTDQLEARHKTFAQPLNVVVIVKTNRRTHKQAHVLLFSSDLALPCAQLIGHYGLRFQLEFNFRDAKQHWGLEDFMQTTPTAVAKAANLAFFMVNVAGRLLQAVRHHQPGWGVLDLNAHYRGSKYVEETIKLLPDRPRRLSWPASAPRSWGWAVSMRHPPTPSPHNWRRYCAEGIDIVQLARFEWYFLPLLIHSERPPKVLHAALANNPALFSEVLQLLYRARGKETDEEPSGLSEGQQDRARLGLRLMWSWQQPPGMGSDGSIDAEQLRAWITEARELASTTGRGVVADRHIGQVLAFVPQGVDGAWPHEAIRDLIEELRSEDIELGIIIGVENRRGATSRSIGASGSQERGIAGTYRQYAQITRDQWPRTTRVLNRIALHYEDFARDVDTSGKLEQDSWR